jgi:predicted methyltransferase
MTRDRDLLLRRIQAGLARGDAESVLRRRLRLRRDAWDALVDELAAPALAPLADSAGGEILPPLCACDNTGIAPGPFLEAARWVAALRPSPRWEIDQVHTTVEDLARRTAFVAESGDLDGKDLLFVGDDDLCSLVVCATGAPRRVVVVDIDDRILDCIRTTAGARGMPIEVVRYDLERFAEDPTSDGLAQEFDVFLTDPPYSEAGSLLFCAFGMAALRPRPGSAAYVALPWLAREAWSDELQLRVQRAFLDQGFFLTDVRRGFHGYEHPDGVVSSYLRAQLYVPGSSPRALLDRWDALKLYSSRRWTMEDAG